MKNLASAGCFTYRIRKVYTQSTGLNFKETDR